MDKLDSEDKSSVNLEEFKELMAILEEAGWRKQKPKKVEILEKIILKSFSKVKEITDMDLKAVFRLVDVDKSGSISRTVTFHD